ncbi:MULTISPECIES: hypothetical protein [unclassified Acinetobacter]|uniref:hypothetical protein n=1 Tax=unclassified Acinetobacter TaxID=196816 RepID=UPI001D0E5D03|nr:MULTISPECIES: hypothetical protein [unclassified Acinetobacter]
MNLQTGTNFIGVIAATFGNVADVLDRQLQMKVLQVGESAKLRYLKGWATRIARGGLYWNAKIKESSLQQWLRLSFVGNKEGLKGVPYTSYAQQQKDFSKVFS